MVLGELKWGAWLCWVAEQVLFGENFIQADNGEIWEMPACLCICILRYGLASLQGRSFLQKKLYQPEAAFWGKEDVFELVHTWGRAEPSARAECPWQMAGGRAETVNLNLGMRMKSSCWEKKWDEDKAELPTLPRSAVQHLLRIFSRRSKQHFDGEMEEALLLYCRYNFVQHKLYCTGSAKKWYRGKTDGSKQIKSLLRCLSISTGIWLPGDFSRFSFVLSVLDFKHCKYKWIHRMGGNLPSEQNKTCSTLKWWLSACALLCSWHM